MIEDTATPSSEQIDPFWRDAAFQACCDVSRGVLCPACKTEAVHAEWHMIGLASREAVADLKCQSCSATVRVRLTLPATAREFCPFSRIAATMESVAQEVADLFEHVRAHEKLLPAAAWMLDPLWLLAGWSATAFRWHPASEAPPIMGLVFDNGELGRQLFGNWREQWGNTDGLEEIRISIIEGEVPGQDPGYSVHICAHPENFLVRATAGATVIKDIPVSLFGQVRRMHPLPGTPPLLARFKEEFRKHEEFLLAPVTRRNDGQLWIDVQLGIIKHAVHFRHVADIGPADIDAVVLRAPIALPPLTPSQP
jgi:hypothetical protein